MKTNKIIDSHVHISMDFPLDQSAEAFRWFMDKTGIERINFLALNAHVFFEETQLNNSKCLYLKSAFSPYGYAGYCIDHSKDMTREGVREQIKIAVKAGFDCWKIIEAKPNSQIVWKHTLDSEIYDGAFSYAEEIGLPIVVHTIDPIEMWQTEYANDNYLSKIEYRQQVLNILKKYPNLYIILAHMGFMSDEPDLVENLLNTYPNLRYDVVPAPEEYFVMSKYHADWTRLFNTYSTRFLFGTDRGNHGTKGYTKEEYFNKFPETVSYQQRLFINGGPCDGRYPFPGIEELWGTEWYGLNLSDEAYNNLMYNNFMTLYGQPKPIDYKLLKEIAEYEFSLPSKSKYLKEDYKTICAECKKHGA